MNNPTVSINAELISALKSGKGIVALESTIITHGMPYPENLQTARLVEQTVRDAGAVPATIAVLAGTPTIGLSATQLESLAKNSNAMKLSRADLGMAVAQKANGSTTVAATMILASLAGIKVFATGGIGGVHKGAESTFDISADLRELSITPVHVVCAGAKAILDIPKTLEVLETLGVPVMTYQQSDFPAFWSRQSGIASPLIADNVSDLVRFIQARESLSLSGGILIGNPVPESAEIDRATMSAFIQQAIEQANNQGISGKALTPWLLNRLVELTDGLSLQTNQALILNNAALAAQLSVALATSQPL